MADRNILHASDVTIEYPAHSVSAAHTAVRGVTLTVAPGEIVGIVGSSGSGKSTLAQVASGQAAVRTGNDGSPRVVGGSLEVLGYEMRGLKRRKLAEFTLGVGYVAQDAGSRLTSNMTVAELVAEPLFLRDKRFDRKEAGLRAATLVDALLLPVGTMLKQPHELSSGQRQRVAVARGLILDPVLLIADEPTAGVDVSVRGAVIDVIAGLQRSRGASALIVSHDLESLRRAVDRVAVIHEGVVVGLGTMDEVFDDPRHPYVASLAAELHDHEELHADDDDDDDDDDAEDDDEFEDDYDDVDAAEENAAEREGGAAEGQVGEEHGVR
ncbi:dipeptide/oligopeptide/nickel ABC transporter ATP-binding protein [Herbiconiux sp.]|uniref:ATP-binding cassette domain-containing protein n=1 Tax=Herbiconiux sp. TaxID=1871186 RepID=UPI0025C72407|nr:dipeptide/oligopeptide/nickel ABC transporter ATP-binding protein [Herbiconiux sp.]